MRDPPSYSGECTTKMEVGNSVVGYRQERRKFPKLLFLHKSKCSPVIISFSLSPIPFLYSRRAHFQLLTLFSISKSKIITESTTLHNTIATLFATKPNLYFSFSLLCPNTSMSELSLSSNSNKKNDLSCNNLLSVFFHLCFSIFSHPLYFSYFIFFSPYLLKLLSFLSPLFITTALLLVALLTFTPNLVLEKGISTSSSDLSDSESKLGFLLSILQTFLAWFLSESDEEDKEVGLLDELEAYLVMFQASICEVIETKSLEDNPSEGAEAAESEFSSEEEEKEDFFPVEEPSFNFDENPVEKVDKEPLVQVKSLESLFQENAELEDVSCQKENKEANKVEESKENYWPLRSGSKVMGNRDIYASKVSRNSDGEHALGEAIKVKSQRLEANLGSPQRNWEYNGIKGMGNNEAISSNLGSFGSMRVEKEWRRTLACKLFEERHNASEGMDMLWETYEAESNKGNTKKGKKGEVESTEEEEDEEEEMEGKLCCLQALKFSTGKMNLGMGRPSNLLKLSKAFKGIGWLHRHGRKSNH